MLTVSFQPFPALTTGRLLLRQSHAEDAADLFLMRSDPEVMRYIPRPLARSEEDMVTLVEMLAGFTEKGEGINWAIEWKETGQVIGLIGFVSIKPEHFRAEVGYSLTRAWHRRGIMREALQAVVAYGFGQMNLHSIETILDEENRASAKLLEDSGFVREACFREDFFNDGAFRNSIHYGLLKPDAHTE